MTRSLYELTRSTYQFRMCTLECSCPLSACQCKGIVESVVSVSQQPELYLWLSNAEISLVPAARWRGFKQYKAMQR
jgi:hypothetical protein